MPRYRPTPLHNPLGIGRSALDNSSRQRQALRSRRLARQSLKPSIKWQTRNCGDFELEHVLVFVRTTSVG